VRELTGDEGVPVSSDGAVAMAVVTGPVLPPKAAEVHVPQEPSIVVKDIAATARAIADEESRRRQTVRLDELNKDPAVAALYAKYEAQAASQEAPAVADAAPAPRSEPRPAPVRRADAAPLPEAEPGLDEGLPVNNNRKWVFGLIGAAAVLALLGVARATLSGDESDAPTATGVATGTTTTTAVKPAEPPARQEPGASPTGAAVPEATTRVSPSPTTPSAPPGTTREPEAKVEPKSPPKVESKVEPKPKPTPPPPPEKKAAPQATATPPKPGGTGKGIIREVPF
jgi:hypothetical protein